MIRITPSAVALAELVVSRPEHFAETNLYALAIELIRLDNEIKGFVPDKGTKIRAQK